MEVITTSPHQTQRFAAQFLKKHLISNILALYGDLGSGKTTFVQGLARALGVTQPVTSPAFILLQLYPTQDKRFKQLVHLDLYRITGWREIEMLGLPEIWGNKKNLVVIEWPEKIEEKLPQQTQAVRLEYISENKRKLRI